MSVLGDIVAWANAPDKPRVPKWEDLDTSKEQMAVVEGNLAALPKIQQIAAMLNEFNRTQTEDHLAKILPQYRQIMETGSSRVLDLLSGKVPQDVADLLGRRAAEMSVSSGTSGSQFADFRNLRSYGLTGVAAINEGLNAAQRWINGASNRVPTFDSTSMFISPQERIAVQQWQIPLKFQRNWLNNQIKAMLSPSEQAFNRGMDNLGAIGESIGTMALGGMGGAGGALFGGGAGGVPGLNGTETKKTQQSGYYFPGQTTTDPGTIGAMQNRAWGMNTDGWSNTPAPPAQQQQSPGYNPQAFDDWWRTQGGF